TAGVSAPQSWRESIKITRLTVFAVLFILVGAWVLIAAPQNIAADATTLLTFNRSGTEGFSVPTVGFAVVVALSYVASGVAGLLPLPSLKRATFWWMVVNGMLLIPLILVIIAAGGRTNITVMVQESLRLATPII